MEQSKTLKIIQTICKIAKIISTIVFVCCIIGAAGCLTGIIAFACIPMDYVLESGKTIQETIETSAKISVATMYAAMFEGMFICLGEVAIAKIASIVFDNELKEGQPFNRQTVKDFFVLGICSLAIPLAVSMTAGITLEIYKTATHITEELELSDYGASSTMGIAFLLLSLLCKYGCEVKENKQSTTISE